MASRSEINDLLWVREIALWSSMEGAGEPPKLANYEKIANLSTIKDIVLKRTPLEIEKVKEFAISCIEILSTIVRKLPNKYLSRTISPANFAIDNFSTGSLKLTLIGFIRRGWQEKARQVDLQELYRTRAFFYMAPELTLELDQSELDREKPLVFGIAMMMYQLVIGKDPFYAINRLDFLKKCHTMIEIPENLDSCFQNVLSRLLCSKSINRPGFEEAFALLTHKGPLRGPSDRTDSKESVENRKGVVLYTCA